MNGTAIYIFITSVVGVGCFILGIMVHKLVTETNGRPRPIIVNRVVHQIVQSTPKETNIIKYAAVVRGMVADYEYSSENPYDYLPPCLRENY